MRISDWSSDVSSSDLLHAGAYSPAIKRRIAASSNESRIRRFSSLVRTILPGPALAVGVLQHVSLDRLGHRGRQDVAARQLLGMTSHGRRRSEEHTSELQSLMRISYAVFCLKKKKTDIII